MKIVIADDHALFAEGLKNLLEAMEYNVSGVARNGIEAFELAKKLKPDVMLIDIYMPGCDGLEATMMISTNFPKIKIVILTSSENEKDIFNALKAGACSYFIKNFDSDKLFEVLESLKNGEIPVSPGVAGKILEELRTGKQINSGSKALLTERQREVLALVAQGYIYKEIAKDLGISERTFKYHIQNAIDKLHLHNRNQLINYLTKSDLLG